MKAISSFLLALCASCSFTLAADYSEFYVFGDSLSDAGNTPNPEPYNEGGRFTNGKVWNEYLAEMLGMPVPQKSTLDAKGDNPALHATNFAYGGAMTNRGPATWKVPSVLQQIRGRMGYLPISFDRYGKDFEASDLVSIWAGANNLFFSGQTNIFNQFAEAGARAAREQDANIRLLLKRKVKNLIVLTMPDIGKTPSVAGSAEAAGASSLFSMAYNKALAAYLVKIQKENPGLQMIVVDVQAILAKIEQDPKKYGFSDFSSSLVARYEKDAKEAKLNPAAFVFYDDVHPTTAVHRMIAEQVYAQLKEK